MIKGVRRQVENPRKGLGGKRQGQACLLQPERGHRLSELGTRTKDQENHRYQLVIELERDCPERGIWCKHVGVSEKLVELKTGAWTSCLFLLRKGPKVKEQS